MNFLYNKTGFIPRSDSPKKSPLFRKKAGSKSTEKKKPKFKSYAEARKDREKFRKKLVELIMHRYTGRSEDAITPCRASLKESPNHVAAPLQRFSPMYTVATHHS